MDELRDIQGLIPVSSWPLAIGWWLILGSCIITLFIVMIWVYKRYKYNKSWQGKAFKKLTSIEDELQIENLKPAVQILSAEIRHIAMQSFSRDTCAGLPAKKWLSWLQDHDPQGFVWTQKGDILIKNQYSRQGKFDAKAIREILTASKEWVRKCDAQWAEHRLAGWVRICKARYRNLYGGE